MKIKIKYGSMRNQCAGCGKSFSAIGPFDKHRTGTFGVDRRCRTDAEMAEIGFEQDSRGDWRSEGPDAAAAWRAKSSRRKAVARAVATSESDALQAAL